MLTLSPRLVRTGSSTVAYALRVLGVDATGALLLDDSTDGGGFVSFAAKLTASKEGAACLEWSKPCEGAVAGLSQFAATLSDHQICGEGHGRGWKCSFTLEPHSQRALQRLLSEGLGR